MYAVAFDLIVADAEQHHPRGVSQAYAEIGAILGEHGFDRVQGSLYVTKNEDMAQLFLAIQSLRSRSWFPGVGSRSQCETSARSASGSGPTSLPL